MKHPSQNLVNPRYRFLQGWHHMDCYGATMQGYGRHNGLKAKTCQGVLSQFFSSIEGPNSLQHSNDACGTDKASCNVGQASLCYSKIGPLMEGGIRRGCGGIDCPPSMRVYKTYSDPSCKYEGENKY